MATEAFWYPFLGWGVFWIGMILAIVLFAIYKKLYPVLYLVSISLYIFTIGFMIDVFHFEKFAVLASLVVSALVFMGLGYYLSQVLHLERKR